MTDKTYALVITVVAAVLASVVSFAAFASNPPVINYPDGSTYTLKNGQEIFVAHVNTPLFIRQDFLGSGNVSFTKQVPWPKRDYIQTEPANTGNPGEHSWCKAFVPAGYTFELVSFYTFCDTNNDEKYGCGDDPYDASSDGEACPSS